MTDPAHMFSAKDTEAGRHAIQRRRVGPGIRHGGRDGRTARVAGPRSTRRLRSQLRIGHRSYRRPGTPPSPTCCSSTGCGASTREYGSTIWRAASPRTRARQSPVFARPTPPARCVPAAAALTCWPTRCGAGCSPRPPRWTADEAAGINLAERIESGTVGVNCYELDVAAPFGGVKASGLGRELGPEGLQAYLQPKTVYLAAAPRPGN